MKNIFIFYSIIIGIVYVFLCNKLSGQPCNLKFELVDSIKLLLSKNSDGSRVASYFFNDTILLLDAESGEIIIYIVNGDEVVPPYLNIKLLNDDSTYIRPRSIIKTNSEFIIYPNSSNHHLVLLSKSGSFRNSIFLNHKFNGKSYKIMTNQYIFKSFYQMSSDKFFFPIKSPFKYNYKTGRYSKGVQKHYKSPGLVGVFNSSGKVVNVIGKYDSMYLTKKFLAYLDQVSYYVDTEKKLVFIGQEACPIIRSYDLNGLEKMSFGENGFFVKQINLPLVKNSKDYYNNKWKYKLISYAYNQEIYYDSNKDLFFRTYRIPMVDTTTIPSTVNKDLIMITKKIDFCAGPTKQQMDQLSLLNSKPYYLQVYDIANDGTLIYDGLSIRNGKYLEILKSDDQHIWISGGVFKEKVFIIYKFKVSSN